jgi:hypothetical protein
MRLSEQRHKEIEKELQQIRERVLLLADQIATETASESDYMVTSDALRVTARLIAQVPHLMELALRLDEMRRAST